MRYLYVVLIAFICSVTGYSQSGSWQGVSVDFLKGRLEVSKNGRYLQHKNGTPFFYLADTAWELFHRLNEKEIEEYLEDRRAKGFTVIQAAILAELDGLYTPDANGQLPLKDIDNVIPNETYFKWVDKVIRIAESKGLYIGLLPTWGDKVDKQEGTGPEIFNPAHARAYGAWLGKRYKNVRNIIWINGGDRWGGDSNFAIWDNIGKGIKSTDKNHLMTFLPPNEHSSSRWFHNNVWLDFNMVQTGNCQRDYEIYETLLIKDYERYPTKPCLDGKLVMKIIRYAGKQKQENGLMIRIYDKLCTGACSPVHSDTLMGAMISGKWRLPAGNRQTRLVVTGKVHYTYLGLSRSFMHVV